MTCDKCGTRLEIGMYPFCRGRAEDHGAVACGKTALFPFEGRNITPDGSPITIESMSHLRRVEREYGVVLSAFSKANIRDTDPIPTLPRYRGGNQER